MTPKQQTSIETQLTAAALAMWIYFVCVSWAIQLGK